MNKPRVPSAFLGTGDLNAAVRRLGPDLIGTRIGAYNITGFLGAGAMGEVYRGHDSTLGRDVAIKVLPQTMAADPERMVRFEREARTLAAVNHPNIATIHGVEESNGTKALVLELVEGPTLADRLAHGPLAMDEALRIANQIAGALKAAHDIGIVHRDLKPANIKVRPDGTVKVLDFGLAKITPSSAAAGDSTPPTLTPATQGGMVIGTPQYMSPEQAQGSPVDRRTDIWSFGCVLFEMITGRPAFNGNNLSEVMAAVIGKDPDWGAFPTRAGSAGWIARRCLEKDLKSRFQDMGDVRLALDGAFDNVVSAPTTNRRLALWTAVAVLSAGIVSLSLLVLRPDASAPQILRYQIFPPSGETISEFALSPDGRRLVFTTGDLLRAANSRVWVRDLDSFEAQPVRGANGAYGLFWSQDSRSIAFFTDNANPHSLIPNPTGSQLMTLDLLTGEPEKIADVPAQASGAWNRNILLFTGITGALYTTSGAGANPVPATSLDRQRRELAHRFPSFLPDGRRFLFTAISAVPENSALYVGELNSANTKRLLSTNSNAAYTRDPKGRGYLLFVRGETLMGQRFDADALALQGDAFPVALNFAAPVGSLDPTLWPQFSISANGVLAYQAGGLAMKELVWFDRAGRRLGDLGDPGDYSNVALSPDERLIAISRLDPQVRSRDIWVIDVGRGVSTRLTSNRADDTNPVWSPDSRKIAFASTRNGPRAVYLKPVNETGEEQLVLRSAEPLSTSDWTSDGRFLIVNDSAVVMEGEQKTITLRGISNPSVSPDGQWIAYHSDQSGRIEVVAQHFPSLLSGGSAPIWQVSTNGGSDPEWRRDSQELFYLAPDDQLMAVDVTADGHTLRIGRPKSLFRVTVEAANRRAHYQPAANGQRFLFVQPLKSSLSQPINVVVNWPAAVSR